jgi:type IV pilus assembly protein PilF
VKKWRLKLALFFLVTTPVAFASVAPHELASLHAHLAFEYSRAGQQGLALDAAERAVEFDATYVPAWLARAHVLSRLDRAAEAETAYRHALDLAPGNSEANNNFGRFLCARGRVEEGMVRLDRALADLRYSSSHLVRLNMGRCSQADGRSAVAEGHFKAALAARPNFVPALRELSVLYLARGDVKLASFYHGRLLALTGEAGPEDLLLGVGIARQAGDRVRENDFATKLLERFPDSRETQQLVSGT